MACENHVGVKNILISFTDCDTGQTVTSLSHKLAVADEFPTFKTCTRISEALTEGYIRVTAGNATMTLNVIRNIQIPLAWYQGCAALDVQVEFVNGLVYSARGGTVVDADESDSHGVTMALVFKEIDERRPSTMQTTLPLVA